MTPQEEIARAHQAKALVDDPILVEARKKVEDGYTTQWRNAKTPVEREECHARISALADVFQDLTRVIDSGKFAARKAEVEAKRQPIRRT